MPQRRPIFYAASFGAPTPERRLKPGPERHGDGGARARPVARPAPEGDTPLPAPEGDTPLPAPVGGGKLSRNSLKTPNRAGKGRPPRMAV